MEELSEQTKEDVRITVEDEEKTNAQCPDGTQLAKTSYETDSDFIREIRQKPLKDIFRVMMKMSCNEMISRLAVLLFGCVVTYERIRDKETDRILEERIVIIKARGILHETLAGLIEHAFRKHKKPVKQKKGGKP